VLTSDTPEFFALHESQYPDPLIDRSLLLLGEWSSQGAKWFDPGKVTRHQQHNVTVFQQQLDAFQPDVCLAGNVDFLQTGTELLSMLLDRGIPVAHYVMNAHPGYGTEFAIARSTYRFITCSDWVIQSLANSGYPVSKAQTVYPGADVDAFYQAELPSRDRLRIAYASLVAPYKGADVLVEALAILNAAGIDFSATIAGGTFQPTFVESLKEFVAAEGLQDKVTFTGALSRQQLSDLFKTHNVLVFPSRFQEPFGISQIEAMAAGLTLVTSGTGGAKEIIGEHGKDGVLFESENPLDLADVLSALARDPEQWEAISRCGQTRAMTEFTHIRAVEQLESVFADLIALKDQVDAKYYPVGKYSLLLPIEHRLDHYQATWRRYDTALGYIAKAVFEKYPNSSAIDIGANVGNSAALVRSNAEVPILCIEGSPIFTSYLKQNAATIGGLEIEACFVGDHSGTVALDQVNHVSGTASISTTSDSTGSDTISMKSLKEVLETHSDFQTAKLLKIDTDGFDFSIIHSSRSLIALMLPILYFEYDITFQDKAQIDAINTLEMLCEIGFERFIIYDNFGNYLVSLSNNDREKFTDITTYLISNRKLSGTPAIYYFDVCAFSADDIDVFEAIRKLELNLTSV
jgi:FkbM family methyltransferase